MSFHRVFADYVTSSRFIAASLILVIGLLAGYLLGLFVKRLLTAVGLPETVEGTAFERSARGLGTSTVGVLAQLAAFTIYIGSVLAALETAELLRTGSLLPFFTGLLPHVLIAVTAIIGGLVLGDKLSVAISERLRGVKLPEVGIIPALVKYSVFYVAALLALDQLGVSAAALLILLVAYLFAVVFLGGLAFRDLLAAGAAGVYLLLNEPYSIGDQIRVGDRSGIVQEIDLFVTHVESDDAEHIIPNQQILRSGIVRVRD